jgi:hypothetical protein
MSKISLKTDYEDGKVLKGEELNVNNRVTMLGVNDNYNKINNLSYLKADITYVDNAVSTKADLATLNNSVQEINLTKADKSALLLKADQTEVDLKANQSYVDEQLDTKANKSYVDSQLSTKVNVDEYETNINSKVDKTTIGDLRNLKTDDKSSVVNAINSINTEAKAIATVDTAGIVKPDGTTITVDQDGTIHSIGSGNETGGTTDYDVLSNKPKINDVELKGSISLDDLGLLSTIDIEDALDKKVDISNVYNKTYIDTNVIAPLNDKADKSYVDSQLESKVNTSNVYNKTTVDTLLENVESNTDAKLISKANVGDSYTKTESDNLLANKADNLSFEDNNLQLLSNGEAIGSPVQIQVTGNEVVVSETQPEDDNWKIWINSGEVDNIGSEVVDSLEGTEKDKAPSVRAVNEALNKIWSYINPSDSATVSNLIDEEES